MFAFLKIHIEVSRHEVSRVSGHVKILSLGVSEPSVEGSTVEGLCGHSDDPVFCYDVLQEELDFFLDGPPGLHVAVRQGPRGRDQLGESLNLATIGNPTSERGQGESLPCAVSTFLQCVSYRGLELFFFSVFPCFASSFFLPSSLFLHPSPRSHTTTVAPSLNSSCLCWPTGGHLLRNTLPFPLAARSSVEPPLYVLPPLPLHAATILSLTLWPRILPLSGCWWATKITGKSQIFDCGLYFFLHLDLVEIWLSWCFMITLMLGGWGWIFLYSLIRTKVCAEVPFSGR